MDLLAVGGVGDDLSFYYKKTNKYLYFTIIYVEDFNDPLSYHAHIKWKWRRACIKLEALIKKVFECILSKTNVFKKLMLTVRGSRRSDN